MCDQKYRETKLIVFLDNWEQNTRPLFNIVSCSLHLLLFTPRGLSSSIWEAPVQMETCFFTDVTLF